MIDIKTKTVRMPCRDPSGKVVTKHARAEVIVPIAKLKQNSAELEAEQKRLFE